MSAAPRARAAQQEPEHANRIEFSVNTIARSGFFKLLLSVAANYTPASAEKGYLSAARYMSPELLSRFEPVARAQLKQVVTNRISQFFAVDSDKVEGKDPLVVRFLGERITYVGRTETERKPYQYRVGLQHVERTQQNPYGLVVSSIEQNESPTASVPNPQSKN